MRSNENKIILVKEAENPTIQPDSEDIIFPQGLILVREAEDGTYRKSKTNFLLKNNSREYPVPKGKCEDFGDVSSNEANETKVKSPIAGDLNEEPNIQTPRRGSKASLVSDRGKDHKKIGTRNSVDTAANIILPDTPYYNKTDAENGGDDESHLTEKCEKNMVDSNVIDSKICKTKESRIILANEANDIDKHVENCVKNSKTKMVRSIVDKEAEDSDKHDVIDRNNSKTKIGNTIVVKEADDCDKHDGDCDPLLERNDSGIEDSPCTTEETKMIQETPSKNEINEPKKKNKKMWTPFQNRRKSRSDSISSDASKNSTKPDKKGKKQKKINKFISVMNFERFRAFISSKLKFITERKGKQNVQGMSLSGAIGAATTRAALLLIDEVNEDIEGTTHDNAACDSTSMINQFDLIDCGVHHNSTESNDGSIIPSPNFDPDNMPYNSIDDVVEEMFKNIKKNVFGEVATSTVE